MKTIRFLMVPILIGGLLVGLFNTAQAAPPLPSSFYGAIHFVDGDGGPGAGDTIYAYVPGLSDPVVSDIIELEGTDLVYMFDVLGDDLETPVTKEGGVEGDTVTFMINGRVVATGIWHTGTNVELNIHPPKAVITGSDNVNEGVSTNYSGLSSTDFGTDIASYSFDWDNDGTYDETGASVNHTWPDNGSYTFKMKAVDAQGGEGTATLTVTVANVAPTVTLNGSTTADEGALQNFTFTTSDPGADTFSLVSQSCGSGGVLSNPSFTAATGAGSFDCVYPDGPALPTASVQVKDSDEASSNTSTVSVTVANVAPTVTLNGSTTADEGALQHFTFTASDPGADTFSLVSQSCGGDGVLSNPSFTAATGAGSFDCVYPDGPASPSASVQVKDSDEASSNTSTVSVTVANVAPIISFDVTYQWNEGDPITFNGTASDPGDDVLTIEWDFDFAAPFEVQASGSLTPTYTYPDDNNGISYIPVLRVTDSDGAVSMWTDVVNILNVAPSNVDAQGPYNKIAGQSVPITGTAACTSVDTCTFAWDLDNDGQYDDATGTSISHTWNTVGSYTIGLQVTDDDGSSATDTAIVNISGTTHSITLVAGWNLVSFNLIPVDPAIAEVLSSITGDFDLVYAWDAAGGHTGSGNWLKYDDVPGSPDTLLSLTENMGFWIHITDPAGVTLNVSGSIPTTTNISLYDDVGGWNLAGYPSESSLAMPGALTDHGVIADNYNLVYAYHAADTADPWKLYDKNAPAWANDLTELSPGWGYWIYVIGDPTWHVER